MTGLPHNEARELIDRAEREADLAHERGFFTSASLLRKLAGLYEERLRVNVGLVAENAKLKRQLAAPLAREQTERARAERAEAALAHYSTEDHWTIDTSGGVYDVWVYDGGEPLPWMIARAALSAREPGKEPS